MKKLLFAGGGVIAAALIYFLLRPVFVGEVILNQDFYLGGFAIKYYGIFFGSAVLAGYFVVRQNSWRFGLSVEETDKISFWAIISALIAARLYFVVFERDYFIANPNEIYQFWNGGISIYGALLGGLVFIWVWSRKKIYSVWQVLDLAALALPLGQAIGRFGNLFNYEAYGSATNLPWKMFVPEANRVNPADAFYHPAFLYEAISNLLIFALLMYLRGKVKSGQLVLIYLVCYGVTRFALEFIRIDSVFVGGWRADQIVSILVILVCVTLFLRPKPNKI